MRTKPSLAVFYKLLYAIPLLFTISASGQEFGEHGAVWYFESYESVEELFKTYQIVEVTGDTVIDGKGCKVFSYTKDGACSGHESYVFNLSGVTYIYNPTLARFDTLFNFNADSGNFWSLYINYPSKTYKVSVDSVYYTIVNGDSLRTLLVQIDSLKSINIYERIGWNENFLQADPATFISCADKLRCYQDTSIGLVKLSNAPFYQDITDVCDTVIVLNTIGFPQNKNITVNPNPCFQKELWIGSEFAGRHFYKVEIQIYNSKGDLVSEETFMNNTWPIKLMFDESLASGLYYLRIDADRPIYCNKKIIIYYD